MIIDRKFRVARKWSNIILREIAPHITGKVVNVSGWKDEDKEGNKYKDYFVQAEDYTLTNYKAEARGFQGLPNEIFLDLQETIDEQLVGKYDCVFNHTVLEHIENVQLAFTNLCALSNDLVLVVVPFLQEQHADYGDYWRFTPLTLKYLFKSNGLEPIYIDYNDHKRSSIYVLGIGSKKPENWDSISSLRSNKIHNNQFVGTRIIKNTMLFKFWHFGLRIIQGNKT